MHPRHAPRRLSAARPTRRIRRAFLMMALASLMLQMLAGATLVAAAGCVSTAGCLSKMTLDEKTGR